MSKMLLTAFLISALSACSYTIHKTQPISNSAIQPSQAQLNMVSYQLVNQKIFSVSCVACHDGSQHKFIAKDNVNSALSFLADIKKRTIDTRDMPRSPTAPLSIEQLQLLNAWIQVGGRVLPVDGSEVPVPPPLELLPNYRSIKAVILDGKCISCHAANAKSKANDIPFTSYAEMLAANTHDGDPIVTPGDPEKSALLEAIQEGADHPMPPKSYGYSRLTADEIKIIEEWIKNGAQN
jgi:mono/diheme cytochrome c family protein